MGALKVKSIAPLFELYNQNEKLVSLSDFKGKNIVVLYFYPRAMTPGCTVQACSIRDHIKEFKKKNIIVLGLSPDNVTKIKKFSERDGLNFDLLADLDHEIADKYGVWGKKKFMGKEVIGIIRSTFIIGLDGKIIHILPKVVTKTHHQVVLDWINENT